MLKEYAVALVLSTQTVRPKTGGGGYGIGL